MKRTAPITVGDPVHVDGIVQAGRILSVLNYGNVVVIQWSNNATTTHRAEDIRRTS